MTPKSCTEMFLKHNEHLYSVLILKYIYTVIIFGERVVFPMVNRTYDGPQNHVPFVPKI